MQNRRIIAAVFCLDISHLQNVSRGTIKFSIDILFHVEHYVL